MRRITTEKTERQDMVDWMVPPPYVNDRELHQPETENVLFSDWPGAAIGSGRLTVKEENLLFRQLHFSAFKLSEIYQASEKRLTENRKREYSTWTQRYHLVRARIIEANQGLVFDLIGRSRFTSLDREEMTSEGMMALLRAADSFNPWKGYRFSTYACNAIIRSFSRAALQDSKRRDKEIANYEEDFDRVDNTEARRSDQHGLYIERLSRIMDTERAELTDIEKTVLSKRFPTDEDRNRQTLEDIGRKLQISKERVRQIQISAIDKLRDALRADPVLQ